MGDDHHTADEQAQSYEPFLSIIETAIHKSDAWPFEYLFRVREIETMFGDVAAVLRLIPFVRHSKL